MSEEQQEKRNVTLNEVGESIAGLKRFILSTPQMIQIDFENVMAYLDSSNQEIARLNQEIAELKKKKPRRTSKKSVKKRT